MLENREILIETFIAELKVKMANKLQRNLPQELDDEFTEQMKGIFNAFIPPLNTVEFLRGYMENLLHTYQRLELI